MYQMSPLRLVVNHHDCHQGPNQKAARERRDIDIDGKRSDSGGRGRRKIEIAIAARENHVVTIQGAVG